MAKKDEKKEKDEVVPVAISELQPEAPPPPKALTNDEVLEFIGFYEKYEEESIGIPHSAQIATVVLLANILLELRGAGKGK